MFRNHPPKGWNWILGRLSFLKYFSVNFPWKRSGIGTLNQVVSCFLDLCGISYETACTNCVHLGGGRFLMPELFSSLLPYLIWASVVAQPSWAINTEWFFSLSDKRCHQWAQDQQESSKLSLAPTLKNMLRRRFVENT